MGINYIYGFNSFFHINFKDLLVSLNLLNIMFTINFKDHSTKYNYSTKLKQNCIVNAPICTSIFSSRL